MCLTLKRNHAAPIDNKVLTGLESDLQKRLKRICEKMDEKYVPPRKFPLKRRANKKPKKKEYSDDNNTKDDDDAELEPKKHKRKG